MRYREIMFILLRHPYFPSSNELLTSCGNVIEYLTIPKKNVGGLFRHLWN